ncbi:substrate-binding domain-containing protein [Niabella sp. W65]|nr:substrate-binding domain-containing protein [Niabella sp. W65]MCH7363202.1 substrate-binding domain-containing protein [Niabella sp. W65]ULT39130.1 substrate-binding domain-containing protein [Niabella sp. I65]
MGSKIFNPAPAGRCHLFATNYLAIQGLKVLQELKWKIPSRVAVLSFDDHEIFKLYTPAITSISQPISAIARKG